MTFFLQSCAMNYDPEESHGYWVILTYLLSDSSFCIPHHRASLVLNLKKLMQLEFLITLEKK